MVGVRHLVLALLLALAAAVMLTAGPAGAGERSRGSGALGSAGQEPGTSAGARYA